MSFSTNLSSLTTRIYFDDDEALDPFTHNKLQSLHITCTYITHALQLSDLFNALSLPNLHMLHIWDVPGWPHEAFKTFLARSKCPLESLVVFSKSKMKGGQLAEIDECYSSSVTQVSRPTSTSSGKFEGVQGHWSRSTYSQQLMDKLNHRTSVEGPRICKSAMLEDGGQIQAHEEHSQAPVSPTLSS
ncbi:uncharacterized protein BJ212DRAFT_1587639 [Suillus subaureus]|uniref:Uncharacterized protein n=1 Tax=Suillus subaureus TaxID=48587 RepID=A0A9P7JDC6_9AGAM|nr:uncharacterized protein BJ212DRAFT_1587639 [Suillus subaureus]KAG1816488.1 hypothetical protein BJ212DRAFT_1587639 [Suillus subaureus]